MIATSGTVQVSHIFVQKSISTANGVVVSDSRTASDTSELFARKRNWSSGLRSNVMSSWNFFVYSSDLSVDKDKIFNLYLLLR